MALLLSVTSQHGDKGKKSQWRVVAPPVERARDQTLRIFSDSHEYIFFCS